MSVAAGDDRRQPHKWTPQHAVDRYLRRRGADATDASIQGWRYRLRQFIRYCDSLGIDHVGQLQALDVDEYYDHRASDVKPVTLEGEMWTLHQFLEYLEDVNAVHDGLADAVRIPEVGEDERSSDIKLDTDAALALLRHYRSSESYGSRYHALLELLWMVGCRQSGLRALDLHDVYLDDGYVEFRHRPDTDTGLKNSLDGERPAGIPPSTVSALRRYINHTRLDVVDDHDRAPLFPSQYGRPTENTVRNWTYQATQPCRHRACPHGHERDSCSYTRQSQSSQCPSSRAPHHVRTGSITHQLNKGFPPGVVAERVNADVKTIKQHYDKADRDERRRRQRRNMEQNRRQYVTSLEDLNDPDN